MEGKGILIEQRPFFLILLSDMPILKKNIACVAMILLRIVAIWKRRANWSFQALLKKFDCAWFFWTFPLKHWNINTQVSFQSCNCRSTVDICRSPRQHFLKQVYNAWSVDDRGFVFLDTQSLWAFSDGKDGFFVNIDLWSQRIDILRTRPADRWCLKGTLCKQMGQLNALWVFHYLVPGWTYIWWNRPMFTESAALKTWCLTCCILFHFFFGRRGTVECHRVLSRLYRETE